MSTPNVLIVAVDTLRADHLGCYGYRHPTSPNVDALARQGTLAENFFCAGLPTHPSFTTLYTGQHPIRHGIVAHMGTAYLSTEAPFLPQILLENGYTTAAFDNLADHRDWFRRGYEFYVNPGARHILSMDVSCEDINQRVIPWLRTYGDEPFFAFLHYWDPHWPLTPPEKYQGLFYAGDPCDPENHSLDGWWEHALGQLARDTWLRYAEGPVTDARYLEALYDQEIRHLDDGVGQLLDALDGLGLADDTLVLFLGDHGECITEHDTFLEHRGLYETTIHVPFIARWPGQVKADQRISALLQHQDVAPTILEAFGLDQDSQMDGVSFWKQLTGEDAGPGRDRIVCCESTWQAKWGLRTHRYKYILSRAPDRYGKPLRELYDLSSDPAEEHNLAKAQPALATTLERDLEAWIAAELANNGQSEDPIATHGVSIDVV